MAYHIHTTDGIIIARVPSGEASVRCWILTRDLGLVIAHAQGVREMKSKLRPHVQIFTRGSFSLVRGKTGWRLTSALAYESLAPGASTGLPAFARACALAKILIAGEERNSELYDVFERGFLYLHTNACNEEEAGTFERLLVLRALFHLGYLGESALADEYGRQTDITPEHVARMRPHAQSVTRLINASLRETQI